MARVAKVTISLPAALLDAVERAQRLRGETRSQFIRRVVEEHLRAEREREMVEQYIRGYRESPETEEEAAEAERLLVEATEWEPWS